MKQFALGKTHKLCAKVAIDRLFAMRGNASGNCAGKSGSVLSYPLRAVWAENPGRERGEAVQFMITIPKKRLRHAVDRVTMRRRVREAYRLNRPAMVPSTLPAPTDVAFIYIADNLVPYEQINRSMQRMLRKIFDVQP